MLTFLMDLFMCIAATIAVLVVATIWVVGLFAINDLTVPPLLAEAKQNKHVRYITNKIEEYRNARS